MTEAGIKAVVDRLADVARVLDDADDDKAEIFRQLGLKLTYEPGEQLARATITPADGWQIDGVRGPTAPKNQHGAPLLTSEFAVDALSGPR